MRQVREVGLKEVERQEKEDRGKTEAGRMGKNWGEKKPSKINIHNRQYPI